MEHSDIRARYLQTMAEDVEPNLARFDERTGRFLTGGGWAVTNQDIVYPLALLYSSDHPANPYYHDDRLLPFVIRGADAWRDAQFPDGTVEFVKVDGSTWGAIYMPWSMYHWLETWVLCEPLLDEKRRSSWRAGLELAYDGISAALAASPVHNIPVWNAMACRRAGKVFGRSDWSDAGAVMVEKALAAQHPSGFWPEHGGPTTSYNLVYVHALGLYHAFTGDKRVLPALERATTFHSRYSYPDGRFVETIDGRVKYHDRVPWTGHPGFNFLPEGRRLVRLLLDARDRTADRRGAEPVSGLIPHFASAYEHYPGGEEAPLVQEEPAYRIHDPGVALVRRERGWFCCLSESVTRTTESRWGQDRQSFISVWHERTGLIVGGGNSKDQPAWSTFTLDDGAGGVRGLPDSARVSSDGILDRVALTIDGRQFAVAFAPVSAASAELRFTTGVAAGGAGSAPAASFAAAGASGGLTLRFHPGLTLETEGGGCVSVGEEPVRRSGSSLGRWIRHNGWTLSVPEDAELDWPSYPFNPYTADGSGPLESAAGVVRFPLGPDPVVLRLSIDAEADATRS